MKTDNTMEAINMITMTAAKVLFFLELLKFIFSTSFHSVSCYYTITNIAKEFLYYDFSNIWRFFNFSWSGFYVYTTYKTSGKVRN